MPCDYLLDLERRRVVCRAWGVVTRDDAMANRRNFTSDPNFRPEFDQLYDGRDVTRMALTASEVGQLAMDTVFNPKSRRAFITPTSETYSMMRLYKMYRGINAGSEYIQLFRTLEEAEAWLDT